ncbi:hypothetical protein Fmac_011500 [Flemingia macrophylla]|uniref:Uncharacterized protein n=1 Tax=Flemingia macrophylla TaxID=520843 RepID=A0ABD1MMR3_9FABA
MLIENESQKDSSAVSPDLLHDVRHKRSSSRWNEEFSLASSTIVESTQAGELINITKLTAKVYRYWDGISLKSGFTF